MKRCCFICVLFFFVSRSSCFGEALCLTSENQNRYVSELVETSAASILSSELLFLGASQKVDMHVNLLMHPDQPANIKWAEEVMGPPPSCSADFLVASVVIALHEKKDPIHVWAHRSIAWERLPRAFVSACLDLYSKANAPSLPMFPVSGTFFAAYGSGFTASLNDDQLARLESSIYSALNGSRVDEFESFHDLAAGVFVYLNNRPDEKMLDRLWNEGFGEEQGPSDFSRLLLFRFMQRTSCDSYRDWMCNRLREMREAGDIRPIDLWTQQLSLDYLAQQLLMDNEVARQFVVETIMRNPGNYYRHLPVLVTMLRYGPAEGSESARRDLLSVTERFEKLAETTKQSMDEYPARLLSAE